MVIAVGDLSTPEAESAEAVRDEASNLKVVDGPFQVHHALPFRAEFK